MTDRLVDANVRERIATDLDTTLFVEAGAGSGKTTVLVDRIVALVTAGGVPMRHIAAVTFTEKAAAELSDRVRVGLEEAAERPGEEGVRAKEALDELDGAAIGTLHAFAARILSEHPIEAGLPPLLEVRDEVASQVAFERRWVDIRIGLLEDAALAPALRLALAVGVDLERHLRPLARQFDANWDLVEERLLDTAPPAVTTALDVGYLLRRAEVLLEQVSRCSDSGDKLAVRLAALRSWVTQMEQAADDIDRMVLLGSTPSGGYLGAKKNWPGCDLTALRGELTALHEAAQAQRARVLDNVLRAVAHAIAVRTVTAAHARRSEGRLEFHDLLVLSQEMLRSPEHGAHVRERLRERYQRLLLDEFQDTDPIQIELAVRIAAGAGGSAPDWRDVPVPAGSLFVVGDPKQSIYRFRRADIATFLDARSRLGEIVELTTNFRSTPDVLSWLNTVFGELIHWEEGGQPRYVGLAPAPERSPWVDAEGGPAVVALGPDPYATRLSADELREREAADVAGIVHRAFREGWQVNERPGERVGQGAVDSTADGAGSGTGWPRRPLRLGDVTILVPARTSIRALETALDSLGVPYRTEATSLVYSAPEVRDLLMAARAVDDPTDQLALVATLRSALCGCGDDDLWRWKAAGGRWSVFATPPSDVPGDDPVGESIRWLRGLARAKAYLAPVELLDRIVVDRRVLEVCVDGAGDTDTRPRHRETWRRVRYVLDQARAWSEAEHGSLREYLAWAGRQADETARVAEAVLPETDADAVRIMTIHAAKGLQFPMVVVSGLASRSASTHGPHLLWTGSSPPYDVRFRSRLETSGYPAASEVEKRMEHYEDLRMLYVACTRAESHLAVSLHRNARTTPPSDTVGLPPAELLASASATATHEAWTCHGDLSSFVVLSVPGGPEVAPPPSWSAWSADHQTRLAHAAEPAAVSATDVAHGRAGVTLPSIAVEGLAKQPRDLELPPWAKGRYGTAVGRAVHAVLQTVDLSTGHGVDQLAASLSLAEGVAEHAAVVAALARSALTSDAVREAAASPHWKETYVGTVIDGVLVEGYVDLLYREADGTLVVVDYKTDAAPTQETVRAYQIQLSLYARAIADATGDPTDTRLVFCAAGPS